MTFEFSMGTDIYIYIYTKFQSQANACPSFLHYKMEDRMSLCALGMGCQEPHVKLPFMLFFLT